MGKIMKAGRVVLCLGGRYSGRKGVVVKVRKYTTKVRLEVCQFCASLSRTSEYLVKLNAYSGFFLNNSELKTRNPTLIGDFELGRRLIVKFKYLSD